MRVISFILGLAFAMAPFSANAQAEFSPAITVNGRAITGYELAQRKLFLDLLRVPGDHDADAERGLIEDRLRMDAAERAGIEISQEQVTAGMTEFAARANLDLPQFIEAIGQGGVDAETYRDFVKAGIVWRETVRRRFANRILVGDADIERAMSLDLGRGQGPRVKISEIFLPSSPATFADQRDLAEELSKTATTEGAFGQAARAHSVSPSRDAGGQIGWIPVTNLPPQMRPMVLGMQPGQVSPPVPLPNAIVLVRLQAVDQGGPVSQANVSVDYAQYLIPGAGTAAAEAEAARIGARAQTCGELYELARGLPADRLVRQTQPVSQVPSDIAAILAGLDENELSTSLRRGDTQVVVMLCDRSAVLSSQPPAQREAQQAPLAAADIPVAEGGAAGQTGSSRPAINQDLTFARGPSADTVRGEIVDQRLNALAASYLAELRASAIIQRQ